MNSIANINPVSILNQLNAGEMSASSLMLQVQMMVTKDFDEQMRTIGKQIKFLGNIKQGYRDKINTMQNFMIQNPNSSRKDGKRYIEASAEQLTEFFGAMTETKYDLDQLTSSEQPILISDSGANHKLDDEGYAKNQNGHISTGDLASYFSQCSQIKDPEEACDFAKKVGDDNTSLPLYFGHTNNKFDDGRPKFSVLTESVDKMLEQVKGLLSDVEQKAEELGTELNQLSSQRKSALDGAYQLIRKSEEMKSNTISKIQ